MEKSLEEATTDDIRSVDLAHVCIHAASPDVRRAAFELMLTRTNVPQEDYFTVCKDSTDGEFAALAVGKCAEKELLDVQQLCGLIFKASCETAAIRAFDIMVALRKRTEGDVISLCQIALGATKSAAVNARGFEELGRLEESRDTLRIALKHGNPTQVALAAGRLAERSDMKLEDLCFGPWENPDVSSATKRLIGDGILAILNRPEKEVIPIQYLTAACCSKTLAEQPDVAQEIWQALERHSECSADILEKVCVKSIHAPIALKALSALLKPEKCEKQNRCKMLERIMVTCELPEIREHAQWPLILDSNVSLNTLATLVASSTDPKCTRLAATRLATYKKVVPEKTKTASISVLRAALVSATHPEAEEVLGQAIFAHPDAEKMDLRFVFNNVGNRALRKTIIRVFIANLEVDLKRDNEAADETLQLLTESDHEELTIEAIDALSAENQVSATLLAALAGEAISEYAAIKWFGLLSAHPDAAKGHFLTVAAGCMFNDVISSAFRKLDAYGAEVTAEEYAHLVDHAAADVVCFLAMNRLSAREIPETRLWHICLSTKDPVTARVAWQTYAARLDVRYAEVCAVRQSDRWVQAAEFGLSQIDTPTLDVQYIQFLDELIAKK